MVIVEVASDFGEHRQRQQNPRAFADVGRAHKSSYSGDALSMTKKGHVIFTYPSHLQQKGGGEGDRYVKQRTEEIAKAIFDEHVSNQPRKRGRKPVFKFTPKNGKLVRRSKRGVDWWRHRNVS